MSEHESTPAREALWRNIALVTTALANGDLSQRITAAADGDMLELKHTINGMIDQLNVFAAETTRLARELGTKGVLGGQMEVKGVTGIWKEMMDNLNLMSANLTTQVRAISKVVTAVANGNMNLKLVVEARGEVAALADTINAMTDMLSIFAAEVTTVAGEVGTAGKLGGNANVPQAAGTWNDLTHNINFMANSLTVQVRSLSDAVQAVLDGDTTRRVTVEAEGEMRELRDRLNLLIERAATAT